MAYYLGCSNIVVWDATNGSTLYEQATQKGSKEVAEWNFLLVINFIVIVLHIHDG